MPNLKSTSLTAIDALIESWSTDTAKSVAESREESAAVIEKVFAPVIDDLERRLEMAREALEPMRDLQPEPFRFPDDWDEYNRSGFACRKEFVYPCNQHDKADGEK